MPQSLFNQRLGVGNGWNWRGVGNCELVTEVITETPFRFSDGGNPDSGKPRMLAFLQPLVSNSRSSVESFHIDVVDSDFQLSHFENCFKSPRACR